MKYDLLIEFYSIATIDGGRKAPFMNGYRPCYLVTKDYLTTGHTNIRDKGSISPGETGICEVKFISPTEYPKTMKVNKVMQVQEGGHVIGYAKVLEIYNSLLVRE